MKCIKLLETKEKVDFKAQSLYNHDIIIINLNVVEPKEFPFIIAHELGHNMLYRGNLPYYDEDFTDNYALRFIFRYYENFDKERLTYLAFMRKYAIPARMTLRTRKLFEVSKIKKPPCGG